MGELNTEDPEMRKVLVHHNLTTVNSLAERFLKFSSWTKLVKAIARLTRFVKEFKGSIKRTNKATSLEERQEAEHSYCHCTNVSLLQRNQRTSVPKGVNY